jgi:localization factor PodJL
MPARAQPSEMREVAPAIRTPAEAAAEAAVAALDSDKETAAEPPARGRSMFGGLSRVFSGRKQRAEPVMTEPPALPGMDTPAPTLDLDEPLDPKLANRPLEPGSGTPDLNAIIRRVRDERGQPAKSNETDAAKSDFIAAARRAAQAAAAEAEIMKRHPATAGPASGSKLGGLFSGKRKLALLAATAIMVALAGLQLSKAFLTDDAEIAGAQQEPASVADQAAAPADELTEMAAPAASETPPADETATADATGEPQAEQPEIQAAPEMATPDDSGVDTAPADITAAPLDEPAATPAAAEQTMPASDEASVPVTASVATTPETAPAPSIAVEAVPDDAGPLPLREAAEAGDPKALFEIGSRYAEGRGSKADMKTAAKWYEKAADLGLAPAQYRIGNFYEKGLGIDRDIAKAKTWYQMAAEQGNASAMHNLAVLYAMGADGTADNESAARWFQNAAELGVKDSQFNLGILAAKGVGMPQSLEESYKWFALVAKTGDRDAATKRDEIANALRPEQLAKARAATELWKAKPVNAETNTVTIPDAWRESDGKTASVDMKQAVRNIQMILNKNGYDAGSADGVMGAKTKVAIATFQKDNGMDATGEVDEKLVKKLLEKK